MSKVHCEKLSYFDAESKRDQKLEKFIKKQFRREIHCDESLAYLYTQRRETLFLRVFHCG